MTLNPYVSLGLAATSVDELETLRKATANRLGTMTRSEPDADGEMRGFAMPVDHPSVKSQTAILAAIETLEKQAVKSLEREMKSHPLGAWVANQHGVGLKTAARLLAAIKDPYIRPGLEFDDGTVQKERPRLVSELWSYSGYGVVAGHAPRRQKGVLSNWNDDARMRCWNIVQTIVKANKGPWREIYDAAKAKYADSVHTTECARCTPAGKAPAVVGSPRKPAHINAMAERIVAKELLKAMWLESKRLHEQASLSS